ncbi:hypothetical protein [Frankia sp. R82]|uniref:hypothetical protein n=1 Tax=Frankia sp. R82 TaxID=2950553 RepID=UPI0020444A6A|nr:hypothetical protein [Frankia sp. R82]MCM3886525.1 hypothetical protein [Frankia sp. R82]
MRIGVFPFGGVEMTDAGLGGAASNERRDGALLATAGESFAEIARFDPRPFRSAGPSG